MLAFLKENTANNLGFLMVNFSIPPDGLATGIKLLNDLLIAVGDSIAGLTAHAAWSLPLNPTRQLIHRAFQPGMHGADFTFG